MNESQRAGTLELQALLHPANAFDHPDDVVRDPDLTLNEKRAILASWASDACAVEAAHDLRRTPGGRTVRWDDIMDALKLLDGEARQSGLPERLLWPLRRRRHRNAGDDLAT